MNRKIQQTKGKPLHILIVRPGAIGDSLLAFPVIKAIRDQYTHPHVTLVSNSAILPLARTFGLAEEVFDYEHPQWSELFSTAGIHTPLMCDLLQRTDLAICWIKDPEGIVKQNLLQAGIKAAIVTHGQPPTEREKFMHRLEYLAETVGLQIDVEAPFILPTHKLDTLPSKENAESPPQASYIAMHPGSGGAKKCWPPSYFADLIDRLCSQNLPVLLLAGPADHQCLTSILNNLEPHCKTGTLKVMVDAPLLEVAQQLRTCKCYLGNDSGLTHLAAMLGIPTLALFGPSDPLNWRPPGPHVKLIRAFPMEQLSVETVLEALNTSLQSSK